MPELDYNHMFTKGYMNPLSICARLNMSAIKLAQYCAMTFLISNLSNCERRKTGALVLDFYDGVPNVVGTGCNGGPPGGTNECETGPCLSQTKAGIIHAEVNAMRDLPLKKSTRIMVCTDSPCAPCLDYMEADGTIDLMVFVREYRISDHLQTSKIPWVVVDQDAVSASMSVAINNINRVIS